jgi:hypothetical protein
MSAQRADCVPPVTAACLLVGWITSECRHVAVAGAFHVAMVHIRQTELA